MDTNFNDLRVEKDTKVQRFRKIHKGGVIDEISPIPKIYDEEIKCDVLVACLDRNIGFLNCCLQVISFTSSFHVHFDF